MSDQHVTAIATIVQDILLFLSACLIGWYLWETRKMRIAAEQQVEKSQSLVAVGYRQLEAQIKPTVVARVQDPNGQRMVEVVNIGSGPALDVKLSAVKKGSIEQWDGREEPFERQALLAFLEPQQERITNVRTRQVAGLGGIPILGDRGFRCEYGSLSGRTYSTIVDFDIHGVCVESTRFSQYPDLD